jgi:hypothetical protein
MSHAVGALYLAVCYQVISYDSSRGGVSVITEKGDVTTSYLLIQHAEVTDSGKYSCSPSNADVASVKVHVLNGRSPSLGAVKPLYLQPGRKLHAAELCKCFSLTARFKGKVQISLRKNMYIFIFVISWVI